MSRLYAIVDKGISFQTGKICCSFRKKDFFLDSRVNGNVKGDVKGDVEFQSELNNFLFINAKCANVA